MNSWVAFGLILSLLFVGAVSLDYALYVNNGYKPLNHPIVPSDFQPNAYGIYMSDAKTVTIAELQADHSNLSLPTYLSSGVSLTATYDNPHLGVMIVYDKSGITDFRSCNLVLNAIPFNSTPPTVDQMTACANGVNGSLVIIGETPVVVIPNAMNGWDVSYAQYPVVQFSWFIYNGYYYQVSVRGLSVNELIKIDTSIISPNVTTTN